ncbi:MAG: hypothetical protein C0625_11720 [Arcobacter sp.]|nr:MAG: hypothetical protein C0625_11720 [Arcobacter sp.]
MLVENGLYIFLAIWAVLGFTSFFVFFLNENAKLKKRFWLPFVILVAVVFIGFGYLVGYDGKELFFIVPGVGLVSFFCIRSIKFCDTCGKTNMSPNLVLPPKTCLSCQSPLS